MSTLPPSRIEKFLQAQFFLKLTKYNIFMYAIQRRSYKLENIKDAKPKAFKTAQNPFYATVVRIMKCF